MGTGFCGCDFCYGILGLRIGDVDDCGGDGGGDANAKSCRLLPRYCYTRCHRTCETFFDCYNLSPSSSANVQRPLLHHSTCQYESCESFDSACGGHPCFCSKILSSYPSATPLDPPHHQGLSAAASDDHSPHRTYPPLYHHGGVEAGPLPHPSLWLEAQHCGCLSL